MQTNTLSLVRDFWVLSKPQVVTLITLTAAVGAALAATRHTSALLPVLLSLLGITLTASSAAAFNMLVESYRDATMKRTRHRPLPAGRVSHTQTAVFSAILGTLGMFLTATFGGHLTAWLTVATFFGYTVIYTLFLKNVTPQNIVIGGASGAMPPVLGWVAVSGEISYEPLLLFLIIFVWTPPHFWALALYRLEDYKKSGLPMLPVTHGKLFTALHIFLYSIALFAVSLLPYASGMSGIIYLAAAVFLGGRFVHLSWRLYRQGDINDGRRLFSYSIVYLALLFAALSADSLITL